MCQLGVGGQDRAVTPVLLRGVERGVRTCEGVDPRSPAVQCDTCAEGGTK